MSIASAITAAQGRVADCYTAISNKGGTLPATQNLANMPTAISSIPSGSTPTLITKTITQNGTYNASSDNADGYSSVTVNVSGGSDSIKANFLILYDSNNNYGETIAPFDNRVEFYENVSLAMYVGDITPNQIHPFQETITMPLDNYRLSTQVKEIHLCALKSISGAFYRLFENMALNNTNLTVADLSGLETIDGTQHMRYAFKGCTNLSKLDFSNLTSVSINSQFLHMIYGCSNLKTLSFPKLSTISGNIFSGTASVGGAFANSSLETLSFPALTTTSGIVSNTFNYMLKNVTGCTVHFPSNLQSTMSSWSSVTSGFGGTNTVVLWDLPATS